MGMTHIANVTAIAKAKVTDDGGTTLNVVFAGQRMKCQQ
jgi:hypothetical protein